MYLGDCPVFNAYLIAVLNVDGLQPKAMKPGRSAELQQGGERVDPAARQVVLEQCEMAGLKPEELTAEPTMPTAEGEVPDEVILYRAPAAEAPVWTAMTEALRAVGDRQRGCVRSAEGCPA